MDLGEILTLDADKTQDVVSVGEIFDSADEQLPHLIVLSFLK